MSLFSIGKRFFSKYPWLIKFSTRVYNFLNFNCIKGRRDNRVHVGTAFMKKCKIKINGKNNEIVFGEKCYLTNFRISITGNNCKVVLGDAVCVHDCGICIENNGGTVYIGEKTLICGPAHFSCMEGTDIHVGKECLFSSETHLRTGDSHSVLDMEGNRINPSKSIIIGDRVWLGVRAMCMKGARVANDSIVSAGAVVTKEFEKTNVAIAGVPAKIVKENIKWCRERI